MADDALDGLKNQLDLESQSKGLAPLPRDFYSKLSSHAQKLIRSAGSGTSEVSVRLINVQVKMIESMTRELLDLRMKKARSDDSMSQLLPEERFVWTAQESYKRRFDALVSAVSSGKPSFVSFANRAESERRVTLRFTKRVDELVGLDSLHYGPYEVDDIASIPASSAGILVSNGDAVVIRPRSET
jgi:hypothetical protein